MEKPGAGVWFIRALCYDKLNQVQPAWMRIENFLDLDGNQHPDQVWQGEPADSCPRKTGGEEEIDRRFPRGRGSVVLLAAALLSCAGSLAVVDKLKELQEHFDRANHAGAKIKDLQKLGALEFDCGHASQQGGRLCCRGPDLRKVPGQRTAGFRASEETGAGCGSPSGRIPAAGAGSAARHPRGGGYMLAVPEEVAPPLEIVRKDLIDMDDALIHSLFPRRTKDPVKVPPAVEAKP